MCHQSVGLIAREIEAAGIPTLSMTSAWSITAAVGAPRAAFVDYPLGHTSGKPGDPAGQDAILRAALAAFETIDVPGTIVDLGVDWGDDAWRDRPMATSVQDRPVGTGPRSPRGDDGGAEDARTERHDTPQYQTAEDRALAEARVGAEVACRACVGFDA